MSNFPSYQGYPAPPFGAVLEPSKAQQLQETYSHNQNRISHTQQQIQELISIRSASRASRKMSSPEMDAKDRQILQLQQQLEATKAQLEEQNERIRQQQATIKHQSDAIQNPKPGNTFMTPHRGNGAHPFASSFNYKQPPPNFDLANTTGKLREPLRSIYGSSNQYNSFNSGPPSFGAPALQSQEFPTGTPLPPGRDGKYSTGFPPNLQAQGQQANEYGSPKPMNHQQGGRQGLDHSRDSSSGTSSFHPTPESQNRTKMLNPNPQPMALTRIVDGTDLTAVTAKFRAVFKMAETYSYSHVNIPSTAGDNALPGAIKDRLIRAATSNTAHYIMSSAQTRYFLVAKLINQWIVKHILKASTYKGFNNEIDANIEKAKGQIFQSTPPEVRYLYLSTVANEIRNLKGQSNFEGFLNHRCRERGNELWAIIKPLMHKKTTKDWDDLLMLIQEAHKLADIMFSGADEYRLAFPAIGQPFQASSMNNRDPFVQVAANFDLQNSGYFVRLGFSPYITVRSNGVGGQSTAGNVLRADVLVRK